MVSPVEPPDETEYLWDWFSELSFGRQPGMSGPTALTWVDIQAYFNLIGQVPERWEIDAIRALDNTYLGVMHDDGAQVVESLANVTKEG